MPKLLRKQVFAVAFLALNIFAASKSDFMFIEIMQIIVVLTNLIWMWIKIFISINLNSDKFSDKNLLKKWVATRECLTVTSMQPSNYLRIFLPEAAQDDPDYSFTTENLICQSSNIQSAQGVATLEECQGLCRAHAQCHGGTWHPEQTVCSLKTECNENTTKSQSSFPCTSFGKIRISST